VVRLCGFLLGRRIIGCQAVTHPSAVFPPLGILFEIRQQFFDSYIAVFPIESNSAKASIAGNPKILRRSTTAIQDLTVSN
jgi:hypothetical protein